MKGAPPSEVINGGAGICTRVRKYIPAGIYDAYPPLKSRSRREEAAMIRRKLVPENLIIDVRNNPSVNILLNCNPFLASKLTGFRPSLVFTSVSVSCMALNYVCLYCFNEVYVPLHLSCLTGYFGSNLSCLPTIGFSGLL